MTTRRALIGRLGCFAAATVALSACTGSTDKVTGITTDTLDVPDVLSLVGSVTSALTLLQQAPAYVANASDAVKTAVSDALAKASALQAKLSASLTTPVSVETGRGWVKDVINGALTALNLLSNIKNVLPTKIANAVTATQTLIPFIQAAVGLVASPMRTTSTMSREQAQTLIASAA